MGSSLSTARQYLPSFIIGDQNQSSAAQNEESTSNINYLTQANSRLNLINQLIGINDSNSQNNLIRSKKKSSKSLNDFQNVQFSSHYLLAGRKFKNLINQSQTFLFGDQLDLAFILSNKPGQFPYNVSTIDTPSNYLQSLVNIRKDTLKLVKLNQNLSESAPVLNNLKPELNDSNSQRYNIEFVFDTDCDVYIKIFYFATEKFVDNKLTYACSCSKLITDQNKPKCICLSNGCVYKKGANLVFKNPEHFVIPSDFNKSAWQFDLNSNYYPIVIECTPIDQNLKHSHITLAYLDKSQTILNNQVIIQEENNLNQNANNLNQKALSVGCISQISYSYQIKSIKQKQFIDGILYSLQEIYGIEKKSSTESDNIDNVESVEQNSSSLNEMDLIDKKNSASSSFSDNMSEKTVITTSNNLENDIDQELKGIECVICMCEVRDTLILPCRHLCLCKLCAINLRVQSNNCPICRIPFIALIQIKLFKKKDLNNKKSLKSKYDANHHQIEFNLPKLTIQSVNDINLIESVNQDQNFIIQIDSKVSSDETNKDVLLKSENDKTLINKKSRFTDIYDCVNIYEAFNSPSNNLSNENKEHKSKKINNKVNNNNQSKLIVSKVNECNTHNNENEEPNSKLKTNSILVNNNSNQNANNLSNNNNNINQTKHIVGSILSKSSIDVRRINEEIGLNKLGNKSSLSCRAQISNPINSSQF